MSDGFLMPLGFCETVQCTNFIPHFWVERLAREYLSSRSQCCAFLGTSWLCSGKRCLPTFLVLRMPLLVFLLLHTVHSLEVGHSKTLCHVWNLSSSAARRVLSVAISIILF